MAGWPMDTGPADPDTSDVRHSQLERLVTDLTTRSPDNRINTPDIKLQGN